VAVAGGRTRRGSGGTEAARHGGRLGAGDLRGGATEVVSDEMTGRELPAGGRWRRRGIDIGMDGFGSTARTTVKFQRNFKKCPKYIGKGRILGVSD
jgi:hypothetical protein